MTGDKEGALAAFDDVLRLSPDDAGALLARGRLAASLGRSEDAMASLERALAARPGDAEILLDLSRVRAKLGLGRQSVEAAEQLVRAQPSDARAHQQLGDAYVAAGDNEGAIAAFDRARALDPSLAGVAEPLGRLCFERGKRTAETGDVAQAARDLARAAELLAADPEPSLALARAYAKMSRPKEAIDAARAAITRREDHVASWVFLGEVQADLGMVEPAAQAFSSALRFDRNQFAAQLGLGLACVKLGRAREAEDALQRAAALMVADPKEASRAHAARAELLASQGRTAEAIAALQTVAAARPLTPREQRGLGQLYAASGDTAKAAASLEQAVSSGATDLDALLDLASAYQAQGRAADAAQLLERITSVDPNHVAANVRLGPCYASLGRHEDAVRALMIARRADPSSKPALEQLASSLAQLGRKLEAAEVLNARAALTPNESLWWIRLGDVLADISRFDDAAATYSRARPLPDAPPSTADKIAAMYAASGEKLAESGNHKDAIDRFQRAIAADARNEKPRLAMARSLVEMKRPEEAMSAAHGALVAAPSSLDAALLLGDLYTKHNKHNEAAQLFEYASKTHPGSFDLAFELGKARVVLGRNAEAAASLRRAVELDPKHPLAKRILARTLESANKPDEALNAWRMVVADEPDDGVANQRIGVLCAKQGNHAEAAPALAKAHKAAPADKEIASALVASYEALGRFEDAAATYQRIMDAGGKKDVPSYTRLGKLYEQGKKLDLALRAYQEAYRADQRNVATIRSIAAVMQALGRVQEAIQWLEGARGMAPRDAEVRFALASCYLAQGRRAEANTEYGALYSLDTQLATKLYYMMSGQAR